MVASRFYRIFGGDSIQIFCHNLANDSSAPDTVPIGSVLRQNPAAQIACFDLHSSALEDSIRRRFGKIVVEEKRLGGGDGKMMDRVQATGRIKKRKAENQDNERLSKRLSLLNLGLYCPMHFIII
jgi:hypothetical protein